MIPLGRVVGTPGAIAALEDAGQEAGVFLRRHAAGDWGAVCPEDARENDRALAAGNRLLSAYFTLREVKLWIITEADRSVTTILLPEDY